MSLLWFFLVLLNCATSLNGGHSKLFIRGLNDGSCCLSQPTSRYASLYFVCGVDTTDNELLALQLIHQFVEVLDQYFGNVRFNGAPLISQL